METFKHELLGVCEILLEYHINDKYLALVKSPSWKENIFFLEQYQIDRKKNKHNKAYCILWGNIKNTDKSKMSVIPQVTEKDNLKGLSTSLKYFRRMVKVANQPQFIIE